MSEKAIYVSNLSKGYGDITALENISFDVNKGELFGLIGPDGAGKTSLFRILTSLLIPDSGSAVVNGFDVVKDYKAIRRISGYMPGRFSLYYDLTVKENLEFFATIFGTSIEENYDLIKDIYIQIEPFKDRKAGKLSGGMKQKLALSCALIHKPEVLFLDEPTTGVDAVSRVEFWDMLKSLKQKGITIIVSTPYMDEAELCERVALIQKGKILEIDSPENIIKRYEYPLYAASSNNMFKIVEDLQAFPHTISAFRFGDSIHLSLKDSTDEVDKLKTYLEKKGHSDIAIESIQANIEDSFMALLQKS